MHISWLGQTCVKIQTKNLEKETKILINAYKPKKGNFPRSFTPDVALFSSGSKNAATLSQDPYIIDTLGEFELNNIVFYSIPNEKDNNILKIATEGITIVHVGNLKTEIDSKTMEKINSPDILFLPVGNNEFFPTKSAANLITALEPRIIIPLAHKCDTDPEAQPLSKFIAEVGLKPENEGAKVIIKKRDLPQEETQLIVLDKE
jgi:L-ascorbate metabolism protein UlaG (beta-lactamase superfamily)